MIFEFPELVDELGRPHRVYLGCEPPDEDFQSVELREYIRQRRRVLGVATDDADGLGGAAEGVDPTAGGEEVVGDLSKRSVIGHT